MRYINIRCPECDRMLFERSGFQDDICIRCRRCGAYVRSVNQRTEKTTMPDMIGRIKKRPENDSGCISFVMLALIAGMFIGNFWSLLAG